MKTLNLILILLFLGTGLLTAPQGSYAQTADELFSYAQNLQRDRLFEAASQQFLRFAMEHPTDQRAPLALEYGADCLTEIDSYDEALRVLTILVETYGDHPDICKYRIRLGKLYQQMRQFEEAYNYFTDITASNSECPQITEAILGRGEALLALRRYEEATAVLTDLVSNYGDFSAAPRAYYGLAMATGEMGNTEEALAAYRKLGERYSRHPLSAFAFLEVARLSVAAGDSSDAVAAYSSAKGFKEKAIFVPACMEGARLLEAFGQHAQAMAWYQELLLRPDLDDPLPVFESAARAAYAAGDYAMVKNLALRVSQQPELGFSPAMLFYQTRAKIQLGEYEQALTDANTLETKAAGNEKAQYAPMLKGEALLATGRAREAIGEYRRFVSTVSDSAARTVAMSTVADIYLEQLGDTVQAIEALEQRIELEQRHNPATFERTARLHERTGNFRDARLVYEDIVATFPFSAAEERAQERLNYIDAFVVLDQSRALREMERAAQDILSLPQAEGRLLLAETRMEMMKDFTGALPLIEQALAGATDDALRAKSLFVKGSCYAGLSKKALSSGDSTRAREELGRAKQAWRQLAAGHSASDWAGRAAYESLFLEAKVTGVVDTLALQQTLARYPERDESATANRLLGDYFGTVPSAAGRRVEYYRAALQRAEQLQDAAMVRLELARALYALKEYDNSLVMSRAAQEDPRRSVHLKAAYQSALSLRQLKRYGEARTLFLEVAAGDPDGEFGARGQLQAADCRYMVADYAPALDDYLLALDRATTNRLAWEVTYRMALCLDKMGQTQEALGVMQDCIASNHGGSLRPYAYDHALRMARSMGLATQEGSLLQAYAEEMKDHERGAAVREELMRWYLKHEKHDPALELSQSMVAASTPDTRLQADGFRAMALYRAGRLAEARTLHEAMRARAADPALLWEVALHASWYYYSTQQYAQCIATAQPLVDDCPAGAPCDDAQFLLTMGLFSSNKIQEAGKQAAAFFSSHPLSPHGPVIHLKFGNALASRNQYSEALGHYQQASETAIDSSVAFDSMKNLAISYQKLSKWKDAGTVWSSLLERFPASSYAGEAALNAARCRMEGGDLPAAATAYRDALPLLDKQGKARAYYWAGECYQRMRNYNAAIAEYLKVPYLVPEEGLWAVTAQLKAAECYVSIERIDSAKNIYEQIVRKYGATSDWGKGAAAALKQLEGADGTKEGAGEGAAAEEQPEGGN